MWSLCDICCNLDFAAISSQPAWKHMAMSESFASNFDQYYIRHYSSDSADALESLLTPYHKALRSLLESTKATQTLPEGCQLCCIVLSSVQTVLDAKKRANTQGWAGTELGDDWSFFVTGRRHEAPGMLVLGLSNAEKTRRDIRYSLMAVLEFRVDYGSTPSRAIQNYKIAQYPCDPILMERVRCWTQHCRSHHEHSVELWEEQIGPQKSPARLLYISENSEILLLNTVYTGQSGGTGEDGYVALSHCWGTTPTLRLTATNIDQMQTTGLSLQDLPRTFQDAVWVTRSLGYRKLWIDSLCILQDDRHDWKSESAKMHSIYRNAAVVIAASRADDSATGFLGPRIEPKYATLPWSGMAAFHARDKAARTTLIPQTETSTETDIKRGYVFACSYPMRWEFNNQGVFRLREEPLSQRAWALQERMLASRTIHFTSEGLYLECEFGFIPEKNIPLLPHIPESVDEPMVARIYFEGYEKARSMPPPDLDYNISVWTHASAVSGSSSAQEALPSANGAPLSSIRRDWRELVCEFSRRLLTFPSDKLPAIAGMAAHVTDIINGSHVLHGTSDHDKDRQITSGTDLVSSELPRYCAGLFLPGPGSVQELLWEIDFRHHQRLETNKEKSSANEVSPRRPSEYRAPSWSWASVDGAIEWPPCDQDTVDLAIIKFVNVMPLNAENMFGEIASARLHLEAITCSLHLEYSVDGYPEWYIYAPGTSNVKMIVLARWDVGGNFNGPRRRLNQLPESVVHVEKGKTDICIAVLSGSGRGDLTVSLAGIIIKPFNTREGQPEGFERLGAAFVRSDDVFTGSVEYLHQLKDMFDSGKEVTEVILF